MCLVFQLLLVSETSEKTDGSSALEQPLDLSAKSAPSATPPPTAAVAGPALAHDAKLADSTRRGDRHRSARSQGPRIGAGDVFLPCKT
ncbi:hypothetical protein EVAR_101957_1 [Eumeta japonica]|uniref:Uncharacterized protein n=1 Tax=Eumeta variegata TaxID=151549 RepID=A0A4C1TSG0_EUMVA|nr:hypothetical protein EVAR_101957_1 [Eumeta japonica]